MRVAYADPPYIGQAKRHYGGDPNCAEVDHAELIKSLMGYDCWALSLSCKSLKEILALCPEDVRVMAWVKPLCFFKPNVGLAYAWEPVIIWHPRKRSRKQPTIRDFVVANAVCKNTVPRGLDKTVHGTKPTSFCYWLFEALGLEPDDVFYDLYPGSGAVTRAWKHWRAQQKITGDL